MFEVYIERNVMARTKDLYIFEKTIEEEFYYTGIEKGHLVRKKFGEGREAEPFLILPYAIADDFFKAIVDAFNGYDFTTDEDMRIKGTLSATRDHLKDLQKLLKLI